MPAGPAAQDTVAVTEPSPCGICIPTGLLEGDMLGRMRCGGGEVGALFRGSKGCGTDMRAASNLLTGREEEGAAGGAADETLFAADPTTPGESRRRGEP